MKFSPQQHFDNREKRLIYEEGRSQQEGQLTENLNQKANDNLAKVSETVKESYGARLELKKDIDDLLQPIAKEKEQYTRFITELKGKLAADSSQKQVEGSFQCLGQTITVVMAANGEYQDYVDQQPVNFLRWAIDTKAKQNQSPNAQI